MNSYKSMGYMDTFISMRHVQSLFKITNYMSTLKYGSPEFIVADNEFNETLEGITHEGLDMLYENILNHFFACGTEESNWTSGRLNSMIIQCAHLDICGSDLGTVPDWDIHDIWERCLLLRGIEPLLDDTSKFLSVEDIEYLDKEREKFNEWLGLTTLKAYGISE